MTTASSWQPLVTGSLAERLHASIDEVLVAVKARSTPEDPWIALLYEYADRAARSREHAATAQEIFERAAASLAEGAHSPALHGGFTGVAWLAAHLVDMDAGDEDPNEDIDAALRALLSRSPWPFEYDLAGGLVGIGVYFIERLRAPSTRAVAAECLESIVERLAELALHSSAGVAWFTQPMNLPAWQRALAPKGYYNFGVAHGIPGILALLAQVCESNIGGSRARELLGRGVDWLLAQPPAQGALRFPSWRVDDDAPGAAERSRFGWCYGDLGVSAALLRSARCVGEPRWEREAIAIARNGAARCGDSAVVRDAGLCHGTAGIAHLFNRMAQATGDAVLEDAARHWFERTLEMRHLGAGIAGYRAWRTDSTSCWEDVPGFLEGAAGVGLALLGATSDVEPNWDRLLLVSIPPRGSSRGAGDADQGQSR
ncbi:lanthionine synthetase C family protein [Sorangium sp. So ce375]|uniref:lanthionine synthetase C family protein n=1 Tax=Sorangium sp. So ce375 TaxID=3133306 RepID=UPI003F5AECCC